MSTPLKEIYNGFWGRVENEDQIITLREDEMVEELFVLFKSAREKFYNVRKNLYSITESGEVVTEDGETFTVNRRTLESELSPREIEILSYLMIVVFYERKMANDDFYSVLELTTSDFKQLSKSNQLAQIRKTVEYADKKAKKLIEMYDRIKNDSGEITTFIDEMGDD